MIIRVTKKHIKVGVRGDASGCPLALAFKDAGFDVRISLYIYEGSVCPWRIIPHTKRSRAFVDAVDAGKPVKPTTFRFKEFA